MITLTRVAATDTFAYRHLDFHFTAGIHAVTGVNGASKSSIFLTLIQGLFNKNPKGQPIDEVSNSITGRPYEIEVWFTKGTSTWYVKNSKKSGRIEIFETTADGTCHERHLKRIPDNLKLLEEIIGCDYATFCDLVYQSPKSSIDLLETSSDGKRKKFINRILQLSELDYHQERMKVREKELAGKSGRLATLTRQVGVLQGSLSDLREELPEIDPAPEEGALAAAKAGYEADLLAHAAAVAAWNAAVAELAAAGQQQQNRSKLAEWQAQLEALPLPAASEEATHSEKEAAAASLATLTAEIQILTSLITTATRQQGLQDKIDSCTATLATLTEPEYPADFCATNLDKLRALKTTAEARVATATFTRQRYESSLGDGVCPTCRQELPNKEAILGEIAAEEAVIREGTTSSEKAVAAIARFEAMQATWTHLTQTRAQLGLYQAEMGEPQDLAELTAAKEAAVAAQEAVRGSLTAKAATLFLHQQRRELETAIQTLTTEIGSAGEVADCTARVEALQHQKDKAQAALSLSQSLAAERETNLQLLRNANANARARRELNKQLTESNNHIRLQLDGVEKELATATAALDDVRSWLTILGSKGYRIHKIEKFLQSFNLTLNRYSCMISSGRIQCRFFLDEDGEIQFTVTDAFKTISFASWSEGQKTRVKLACLFAVLETMEALGVVSFNVLCLDDMLGTIDADGKEGLFKVLDYLRHRGNAIYTVSQFELALALAYDSDIRAQMHEDGTTTITQ